MSTALSLYDLAEETLALDALLGMDAGECTPESDALAQELATAMAKKADAFGVYVRTLDTAAATITDEVDRLTQRKRAITNKVERLKRYGLMALTAMDRPRVEGALFTLSVQANQPKVEVATTVDALPAEYVRIIPESREPDKVAIGKALKAGVAIEGCSLTVTSSLRIR